MDSRVQLHADYAEITRDDLVASERERPSGDRWISAFSIGFRLARSLRRVFHSRLRFAACCEDGATRYGEMPELRVEVAEDTKHNEKIYTEERQMCPGHCGALRHVTRWSGQAASILFETQNPTAPELAAS